MMYRPENWVNPYEDKVDEWVYYERGADAMLEGINRDLIPLGMEYKDDGLWLATGKYNQFPNHNWAIKVREWAKQYGKCKVVFIPGEQVKADEDASLVGVRTQLSQTDTSKEAGRYMCNLQRRARYHSYSLMKQVLVDYLKGFIKGWAGCYQFESGKPILSIEMACGNSVHYQTFNDIPDEDVPCPCGNPKHWIIQYRDLRGKE